ncbi:UNVERIFIED_CONTAM: hypothetical protein GTU68_056261 [Idotea baltica]|nr:hypothetical protein [Idotea baltica]
MADDLGWGDTGFNGNGTIQTPFLDKLASEGIIFDRFYSASPVCSPTRASFLTGRNPLRMNIPGANSGHMMPEEITIPELLKKEGYNTGHYGKWHLGTLTKLVRDANRGGREKFFDHFTNPFDHGYDEFFCTESKVPTYDPVHMPAEFENGESKRYGWKAIETNVNRSDYGTNYWIGPDLRETENLEGENARIIMDRVIPFINKSASTNSPFFTTIWFHTPHLPVVANEGHRAMFSEMSLDSQLYYGSILSMDQQVERLWEELEKLDVADNTILWFCSDNGPERDTPGSSGAYRERKRSLYEGGVRVPAFVVGKRYWEGGIRINTPIVTSDYLPTLADLLDLPYPAKRPMDGVSLTSFLDKEESERDSPIGFIYNNYQKVSWVTDQYKLVSPDAMESFELYDLLKDPGELENIIETEPKIAASLRSELEVWLVSVGKSAEGLDY